MIVFDGAKDIAFEWFVVFTLDDEVFCNGFEEFDVMMVEHMLGPDEFLVVFPVLLNE